MVVEYGETIEPLTAFVTSLGALLRAVRPFVKTLSNDATHAEVQQPLSYTMSLKR